MRTVSSIARILLALVFTTFGLNGFLHFLPLGAPPAGPAEQYLGALVTSRYMAVVFAFELAAGILLLVNRYVVLALTTLAGIIVNILLFHIFMAPAGLPAAVVAALLWTASLWNVRAAFTGLLQAGLDNPIVSATRAINGARTN